MLTPRKHQRSNHQGAFLNQKPQRGAHINLKSNDNEEGPIGYSHLMSMTMGMVLWDTLTLSHLIEQYVRYNLPRNDHNHLIVTLVGKIPLSICGKDHNHHIPCGRTMTLNIHVVEQLHHNHLG